MLDFGIQRWQLQAEAVVVVESGDVAMPVMDTLEILAGHGKMDLGLSRMLFQTSRSDAYTFKNIMYLISKLM